MGNCQGCLPCMQTFFWKGLSVIPDASADREGLLQVVDQGVFTFRMGLVTLFEFPCREIMARPAEGPVDFEIRTPRASVCVDFLAPGQEKYSERVSGGSVTIYQLQEFSARITVKEPVAKPVGLMAVLYGTLLKAL